MANPNNDTGHLADDEIDAYWRGELSPVDEERVELHYLDCTDCQARVQAVETLIDGLHRTPDPVAQAAARVRAWQVAAALFATMAAGATWQWVRLATEVRAPLASRDAPPAAATRVEAGLRATLFVPLSPPTRSEPGADLTLSPDVSLVVFELDVREAGTPGTRFDISLVGPNGRVLLRLSQTASTPGGTVRVPVDRSAVDAGQFLFEVSAGSAPIAIPFVIR